MNATLTAFLSAVQANRGQALTVLHVLMQDLPMRPCLNNVELNNPNHPTAE